MDDHAARIRELEKEVSDAKATAARLDVSIEHLNNTVTALNLTVGTLRDVMNQGRGALWLAMVLAGSIGATATLVIKKLFIGP